VLAVRVLGALDIELDGANVASPASQRPWAVFAFLALAPRPVSRAELASRFWPDVLDASARASLRSALWTLRRALGDCLVVSRDRVGLADAPMLWIDVREFERLATEGELEQALAMCRGELLEGLEDEWALSARQRHRERVIELLEQTARRHEDGGDLRAAVEWTRRQTEHDRFDEDAHRRLMTRLTAAGDRAGALRCYRSLCDRLRTELGVAPSSLTRELIERIRTDAPPVQRPAGTSTLAPGLLPLTGRDAELAELERTWMAVANGGHGTAAVIRGEAGIGKTRLTTELRLRVAATGGRVAACAALDLGGTAPLSLWAELIRELLPELPAPPTDAAWPDDLAVLASELPAHFGRSPEPTRGVPPDLQRTRLFEAVVALLSWAARERPLLLVLEDTHTADQASLELAAYAARRAAELPVMMVFTRRELPHSGDADRLEHALRARGLLTVEHELQPLPPAGVAALARSAAKLSDADVDRVVERAEGNALLTVETARSLARGAVDVAPTLRATVRAALMPIDEDGRALIDVAAVAGRALEPAELEQLELVRLQDSAGEALQTGILVAGGGRLGFRHALLRDAVYAELTEPRRRLLHERWARVLLACEQAGGVRRPAEAARHLLLAGRDGTAVDQLARAASDALGVAALEQAAAYLEEALEIAPDRADLYLELGTIEAWLARREKVAAAFGRAQALLADGPPLELVRAWLRRARAHRGPLCVPHEALVSARAALELLDRADEPAVEERRAARAMCAWAEAVAGDIEVAERLLARFDPGSPLDDLEMCEIEHARGQALMRRGALIESYEPQLKAAEAGARAGRPDLAHGGWIGAAGAALAADDPERALEFVDRGAAALSGRGFASLEVQLLAARSFILIRLGRLEEARAATDAEHRIAEQLEQPDLLAMASHDRGLVALEAGEYRRAASLLAASLLDDAPISRPLTRLALAEALIECGELDAAAGELRATVLEPLRPSDFPDALVPRLTRIQGLLALGRGERDEGERRLRESIAGWERQLARATRTGSMNIVLADLGRPVVGLIEPERELARSRADLETLLATSRDTKPDPRGAPHAVVP
jgi:DNA-binding SARP family transcriptional activator/tetratricopeptide (TPR) repeat protein